MNLVFRLGLGIVFIGFAFAATPALAQSQEKEKDLDRYEDTVNVILRTHLDEEKEYISLIFDKIKKGELPLKIVDRSLSWVKLNRDRAKYPFVYFERVLRIQAKKIRVSVPPFDFSVYGKKK